MFNNVTQPHSPKGYLSLVDSTSSDSEGDVPDLIVDMIPKLEGTHLQVGDLKRWQVQVLPSNAHAFLTESEKNRSNCSMLCWSWLVSVPFLIAAIFCFVEGVSAGVGDCHVWGADPKTCDPGDWKKAVGLCVGGALGSLIIGGLSLYFLLSKYPRMLKARAVERHLRPHQEMQRSLEVYTDDLPVPYEVLIEHFPRFPKHLVQKMHYRQLRACEHSHITVIFQRLASKWLSDEQSYLWKKVENIGNITVERLVTQFENDPFFKESLKANHQLAEAILDHLPETALENPRICKLFSLADDNEGCVDDDEEIQLTVVEAASSQKSPSVNFVKVSFGDFSYSVPKDLLTRNSEYFRALFSGKFHEGQSKEVEIHEWSAVGFEKFVTFCMESKIDLSNDLSREEALRIADQYNSNSLKRHCEEALHRYCFLENYSNLYDLALRYNLGKLKRKIEFDCKTMFSTVNPLDDKFSKITTFLQEYTLTGILEDRIISYLCTSFPETIVIFTHFPDVIKTLDPIIAELSEHTQELYHEKLTAIVTKKITTTDHLQRIWDIACEKKSAPLKSAIAKLCTAERALAEKTWVALPPELGELISKQTT